MTCEEIRQRLSDFVDGELPESERPEVQEHLGTCLPCRRELLQIRGLLERVEELEPEIAPERDLWPAIRMGIGAARWPRESAERSEPGRRPWWLGLAAAVVFLAALTTPITHWWLSRQQAADTAPQAAVEALDERDGRENDIAPLALLARSEDGVLQTRIDLESLLETRRPLLEPETAAVMESHIRIMDDAIAEIRAALDENPGDSRLMRLLATRYQQEAALLQRYSHV